MIYIMGFFIWLMKNEYDFIVIGAGVSGLSAAMYAARLGMKTLVLGSASGSEMPVGGVITTTKVVENWPGEIKISGRDLANKIKEHAISYDLVSVGEEKVESVSKKGKEFVVKSSKEEYIGKSVLFAMGTNYMKLNVPGGKEFENKGVFYCALCDAPLFKNKVVAVAGGSDSGAKGALLLSEHAKKVYIIEMMDEITPEITNLERVKANKKIEVITGKKIVAIKGEGVVKSIEIDGGKEIEVDGVLVAIGRVVLSDLAVKLGVKVNKLKEIMVNHKTCETSMDGVYGAGDVVDGGFKQAITGVAEGCTAAYFASEYVKKNFQ